MNEEWTEWFNVISLMSILFFMFAIASFLIAAITDFIGSLLKTL